MSQEKKEWNEKDIQKQNDNKIDQDFPGFPHGTAATNIINPKTAEDKKIAAIKVKDGEKQFQIDKEINKSDESLSFGSAGAFKSTENLRVEEDDNSREGK